MAKTAAPQVVIALPASPYLGTGNNTYWHSWNLAQLAPKYFGPSQMENVLAANASITTCIEGGGRQHGGALVLNRISGQQTIFAVHDGGGKWHHYQAIWAPASAVISASVGSGGWGKCQGNLHKSFSAASVTITPNALLESTIYNRDRY